jgi:hypothetical protein
MHLTLNAIIYAHPALVRLLRPGKVKMAFKRTKTLIMGWSDAELASVMLPLVSDSVALMLSQ